MIRNLDLLIEFFYEPTAQLAILSHSGWSNSWKCCVAGWIPLGPNSVHPLLPYYCGRNVAIMYENNFLYKFPLICDTFKTHEGQRDSNFTHIKFARNLRLDNKSPGEVMSYMCSTIRSVAKLDKVTVQDKRNKHRTFADLV